MQVERKEIFKVIKWTGVAQWSWSVEGVERCGICHQNLTSICNHCRIEATSGCEVAWGNCRHAYHKHCIDNYLTKKGTNKCPIELSAWIVIRSQKVQMEQKPSLKGR